MVLGLFGGALLASSFLFRWAWFASLLSLVAFALSQRGSLVARIGSAVVFGWAAFVGGYHWLQPSLLALWGGHATLAWAAWFALALWFVLRFTLVAVGSFALDRVCAPKALVLTLPWVGVEWLFPSLFPFFVSSPWIDRMTLMGLVPLGGPLLASALLCIVAGGLVAWLDDVPHRGLAQWRRIVGMGLVLMVALGVGAWSNRRAERDFAGAASLTVGVVQGDVDVTAGAAARALAHRRYLEQSHALAAQFDLDLLVWPETAFALPLPPTLPMSGRPVRADLDVPLLFGAVVRGGDGRWNSALLVDESGDVRSSYHKRFLIPFAEHVPLSEWIPQLTEVVPVRSRFHVGSTHDALRLGPWRIATPICYEAIRPSYVRGIARDASPNLLVTLANDGWFGDSPGARIHLMLARMRAVEHRRYLVRATNTGISAIVDPFGRVLDQTPVLEPATLVGEVQWSSRTTPYTKLGNGPVIVALIGWLLAWFLVGRRQVRLTGAGGRLA